MCSAPVLMSRAQTQAVCDGLIRRSDRCVLISDSHAAGAKVKSGGNDMVRWKNRFSKGSPHRFKMSKYPFGLDAKMDPPMKSALSGM